MVEIKPVTSVDSLSAERKAEKISSKFKKLCSKCLDDAQMKDAPIQELICISIFMAKQYGTPDWRHFDILLIKHMRFLSMLQLHQKDEFDLRFPALTELFCFFCGRDNINHCFMNQLLDVWKQMIPRVDAKIKYSFFKNNKDKLQNCIKFISCVGCYSMQQKMLDILIGYVDIGPNSMYMSSLFANVTNDFYAVYKSMKRLQTAPRDAVLETRKREILNIINRIGTSGVHSTIVREMWFDKKRVDLFPNHESWIDFNLGTKTLEFLFMRDQKKLIAKIDRYSIPIISIIRTNTDFTMEIFIGLKNPLHVEIVTDETATDTIVLRTIHIKFSFGILTHTLENVVRIMFPNQYKFIDVPQSPTPEPIMTNHKQITELRIKKEPSTNGTKSIDGGGKSKNNSSRSSSIKFEETTNLKPDDAKDELLKVARDEEIHASSIEENQMKEDIQLNSVIDSQPNLVDNDLTISIESNFVEDDTINPIEMEITNPVQPIDDSLCDSIQPEQSHTMVVTADVHYDINGNRSKIGASQKIRKRRPIKTPNFDEIISIPFDEGYFNKKVAKILQTPITVEYASDNKENRPLPVTEIKPEKRDVAPKIKIEARRPSRSCAQKAMKKLSEQKDVYYFDDFAVPAVPKPKRKYTKRNEIFEPKPALKRAAEPPTKKTVGRLKAKRSRKLYTVPDTMEIDEVPEVVDTKPVIFIDDDQLTTASFQSTECKGILNETKRIRDNMTRINQNTEAVQFDQLLRGPFYDRGKLNASATYSYRSYAVSLTGSDGKTKNYSRSSDIKNNDFEMDF